MSLVHENDFLLLFPELFLCTAAVCLLVYGVITSTESTLMLPTVTWLSSLCVALTGLLVCNTPVEGALLFFQSLLLDDLTLFCKCLILCGSFISFVLSVKYFRMEQVNGFEYAVLMLLSTCSMLLMVSSYDLLSLYLTIELQSLCFYVLAASKRQSEFSTEAGLKYFLLGAFSSGILLFGSSMIYGFTGSTNFGHLSQLFTGFGGEYAYALTASNGMIVGVLFLAVGFLFKLSAAPFHMWAPDVYEGAPTPVTAFFSLVPKVAFLAVFLRFFVVSLHDLLLPWQPIILTCSFLSMLVGSLAALSQNKIKRVLAFSSVGHVGYMLLATCCGTVEGIQAVCLYLAIYVVMTACTFACLLSLRHSGGSIKYIHDFSVLATTNPVLAITFAICLFSMAGVPPLAGFCSKFYLFFAAVSSSLYVLAFVGVLTSCISCFYYIRLIKIMYFEKPVAWLDFDAVEKPASLVLGSCLLFIVGFFLYPSPLFVCAHKVALSLCL
jgi:proton-translocating NADH-quinone oxidoreductase chain N